MTQSKTINGVYEKPGGDRNQLCRTIRTRDSQGNEPSTNHSDDNEEYDRRQSAHLWLIDFFLLGARFQRARVQLIGIHHTNSWRGRARSRRYLLFNACACVELLGYVRWICNRPLNVWIAVVVYIREKLEYNVTQIN